MKKKYFMRSQISDYGITKGYVDYAALANNFACILNNEIYFATNIEDWNLANGNDCYFDEEIEDYKYYDIYQYYIIDDDGYNILQKYTDEIVYYNEKLDVYLWCITHYGTFWENVLTNIPIKEER